MSDASAAPNEAGRRGLEPEPVGSEEEGSLSCATRTPYHLDPMAIRDEDVIDVTPTRLTRGESLMLPSIFKGLGTTLRHCFENIGRGGSNKKNIWVLQYPEQKRDDRPVEEGGQYRPYFRGVHRLNKDEDGRVRCVACFMCATACPANCIHIVADESPWADREKYPKQFDIDELRCIYCGMCEEACPVDAIVGAAKQMHTVIGVPRVIHLIHAMRRMALDDAQFGRAISSCAARRRSIPPLQ